MRTTFPRYDDIAIGLHWLIAILILGLLAVGKFMTGLEADDPLRFALTQWHKTFGITVLLLSVLRLLWRVAHRPPPDPDSIPRWQKLAAHGTHIVLYVLMFGIPITGWILVSVSPLDVDTLLFNVIPWPHLPPFPDLPNREALEHDFAGYHETCRQPPDPAVACSCRGRAQAPLHRQGFNSCPHVARRFTALVRQARRVAVLASVAGGGLAWVANSGNQAAILAAGDSEVSFLADITGADTPGVFPVSEVNATIDERDPAGSVIEARVETGGVTSENSQMAASLPNADWFDSATHPEATFVSTTIERRDDATLDVQGTLTIKGQAVDVVFPMTLTDEADKQVARGEFTVDRRDFNLGLDSQATDEYVGFPVVIRFRFDIAAVGS